MARTGRRRAGAVITEWHVPYLVLRLCGRSHILILIQQLSNPTQERVVSMPLVYVGSAPTLTHSPFRLRCTTRSKVSTARPHAPKWSLIGAIQIEK